jgi:hypothetical protein
VRRKRNESCMPARKGGRRFYAVNDEIHGNRCGTSHARPEGGRLLLPDGYVATGPAIHDVRRSMNPIGPHARARAGYCTNTPANSSMSAMVKVPGTALGNDGVNPGTFRNESA